MQKHTVKVAEATACRVRAFPYKYTLASAACNRPIVMEVDCKRPISRVGESMLTLVEPSISMTGERSCATVGSPFEPNISVIESGPGSSFLKRIPSSSNLISTSLAISSLYYIPPRQKKIKKRK